VGTRCLAQTGAYGSQACCRSARTPNFSAESKSSTSGQQRELAFDRTPWILDGVERRPNMGEGLHSSHYITYRIPCRNGYSYGCYDCFAMRFGGCDAHLADTIRRSGGCSSYRGSDALRGRSVHPKPRQRSQVGLKDELLRWQALRPRLVIIIAVIIVAALVYLGRAKSHSYRPSAAPLNQN
jgi:hypothetical protein